MNHELLFGHYAEGGHFSPHTVRPLLARTVALVMCGTRVQYPTGSGTVHARARVSCVRVSCASRMHIRHPSGPEHLYICTWVS